MASVTHDYQPNFAGRIPSKGTLGCATNIRIPGGTIVTVDSDGRADVPTNGQNAAGIALATFDNRATAPEGGGADAINVEVLYGVFELDYTGTAPDAGDVVYVADNHTVTTDSNGGLRGIAGYCTAQHVTGKCDVWMGPHVTGQIEINATVVADLDALELEVGDYTGGGGAEADIATGLVQAETDITAAQADIDALEADVVSTDNQFTLDVLSAKLAATGAPTIVFNDGVADGTDLVGSECVVYRWNPSSTAAIALTGVLPSDLDPSADLIFHFVGAREGGNDTTAVLTCELFFHTVGAAYDADADAGGNTTAFDGATTVVTDETLTIAAANVPAASTAFTLTIVPDAALDEDDLLLIGVYAKYTGVALA